MLHCREPIEVISYKIGVCRVAPGTYIYAICSVREQSKWRAYNKGAFWLQVFKGTLLTKKQATRVQGGYRYFKEHYN